MRKPTVKPGELHVYYGRVDGDSPDVVFHSGQGVPSCDRAYMYWAFSTERMVPRMNGPTFDPSFVDELVKRGYDISTLRFRIKKKVTTEQEVE